MYTFHVDIDNITTPSPKVLLMYQAVSELLRERQDLSGVKVSDITSKAGIGKGTAYEYFSSKEELIANAIIYEYSEKFKLLSEQQDACRNFEEKIYGILDWIKENREYNIMYSRLIQLLFGDVKSCSELKEQMPQDLYGRIYTYTSYMIMQLLEDGYQEGLYTETDTGKRKLAFLMMVVGYAFTVMGPEGPYTDGLDDDEIARFAYQSFIKSLNE